MELTASNETDALSNESSCSSSHKSSEDQKKEDEEQSKLFEALSLDRGAKSMANFVTGKKAKSDLTMPDEEE